ncbi:MAG TPA: hypothetical protein VII90_07140 [Anaerolineales bacterium]
MNIRIFQFVRWLPIAVLLFAGSACNLTIGTRSAVNPQFIVVTATGGPEKTDLPSPTPNMELILTPTQTQTPSVTLTPTRTETPTTAAPTMTAGQDLSCVKGPKFDLYDWVAVIKQGETVTLLARSSPDWGEYYYVRMSNGTECWAYGGSSTKNGDTTSLPEKEAPPTPTPAIVVDYSVSYLTTITCGGWYAFSFQVNNTGTVTLESIRMIVTDNTTVSTTTYQLNAFRSYNGCVLDVEKPALSPGQGAVVSNVNPGQINYNPAGHSITAAFTICSADGLGGTCVNRTINFTP